MDKLQVILDGAGHPAFAVLPWHEYERLTKGGAEAPLSDEEIYDRAKLEDDESFPIEVADQLVAGKNAIQVFRKYRGMTQNELAAATNINPVYLSQIETGRRNGSTKTLASIAKVLNVSLDDLAEVG